MARLDTSRNAIGAMYVVAEDHPSQREQHKDNGADTWTISTTCQVSQTTHRVPRPTTSTRGLANLKSIEPDSEPEGILTRSCGRVEAVSDGFGCIAHVVY